MIKIDGPSVDTLLVREYGKNLNDQRMMQFKWPTS